MFVVVINTALLKCYASLAIATNYILRGWKKTQNKLTFFVCINFFSHYEKLCLRQLDCPTTRAPKQLIYNYIATIPWKYNKLINKMPHQKIKELYHNCNMYIYTIQCMHFIYNYSQPCLTLLTNYTLITHNNYITIRINLVTNQQLFCNKYVALSNTYDHATCIQFHHPIYMTLQLVCN